VGIRPANGQAARLRRRGLPLAAALLALVLTACTPPSSSAPSPTGQPGQLAAGVMVPDGPPSDVVTGLDSPWSLVTLPDGSFLVSERGSARILEVVAGGATRTVGKVDGVVPGGEGGLLGLAAQTAPCKDAPSPAQCLYLYAYFTATADNRIVRMRLTGGPGAYTLGPASLILSGIAKAGNHNGGRIAFGPDGMLYATAGDAGNSQQAQDPKSLNGKILRLTPDGGIPADNPFPGSPVYTLGHRNPQGLAWDSSGRLWASEFGQNTWDELNLIRPGHNYGWPVVEGISTTADKKFTNPVLQWPVADASPSGIAIRGSTIYMAALRGQRLWVIQPSTDGTTASAAAYLTGQFGRLRDVHLSADGGLWVLTNNTDGRGTPRPGDDRILAVRLAAVP
jgi:glucose/arabinose dehydrogenase